MFRFFAKRRHLGNQRLLNGDFFTILPASRVSIRPEGAVFLNVERGVIFKSNSVGARIWQGVQEQQSPAGMAAQISRDYGVPEEEVAGDIGRFLRQLEAEGFLARKVSDDTHEN